MKGQTLAICLVIGSGVATCVMSLSTLESLRVTQQVYYDRYQFAHVFARMTRAPLSLVSRIRAIPGVAVTETRVVRNVTLIVHGLSEPAVGRLVSIPPRGQPVLNRLYLRRGRWIDPGAENEVLVGESFAEAHGFDPGDSVQAIINGRLRDLTIVGIALSPEYVLQIKEGDVLPDMKRFGIFWMSRESLEAAYDMDGAFNDVCLTLVRGASEPEVITRLDDLIDDYGGAGAYGRDDQLSHRFVTEEMRQLRGTGFVVPLIFLGVAAFLLNVVVARLIRTQREEIAALKAFGYTHLEVGWHYFKFVLLIVLVGVIAGTALGASMGRGLTEMYVRFYRFPILHFDLDASVVVLAFGLTTAAATLGTLSSVLRAVDLPPAEAMRPEPPAPFRLTLIERSGMQRFLSQTGRMILRQLGRRPGKSLMSSLGIAAAVAVMVVGSFMEDALDFLIEHQFFTAQRQDVLVTLIEPTSASVVHALEQLPGVIRCEPFRAVGARLRYGHRSRRVGLTALPRDATLYRLIDGDARQFEVPDDGLVLSEKLAELLGAEAGDVLRVEVLEDERPVRELTIAGLLADFSGINAYASLPALHRLLREGNSVSGAYLLVDPLRIDDLYAGLKQTPQVAGTGVEAAMLESFNETIAENQLAIQSFIVSFACIIAFGVVYNTARISYSERARELATLRVIGFTRAEISGVLLGELFVLTLVAIPFGLLMGYGFAAAATTAWETELYRIPLIVEGSTFAFASTVITIASTVSGLIVRRRLDHLDLVAVLKSKE